MGQVFAGILDFSMALGACAAIFSGVLQGYSGFGGGLIIVPVLAILFGPLEGIAVASIAGFVGLIHLLPQAAKKAYWPEVTPLAIAIAVATPLGILFLVSADPLLVRRAMGIFIIISAAVMMTGWSYRGSRGLLASATTGALAGGVTGAFGIPGGPFLVLYFLASPNDAPTQRANIVIGIILVVAFLVVGLAFERKYTAETLARAVVIAPIFIVGSAIGAKLFKIAPAAWFKKVALGILLATGVIALVI